MKRLTKRVNSVISSLIAAVMLMSVFLSVPAAAQTGIIVYNYDGYKVEYNVQNEWTGFQTVQVTVTNTGTEPIINWAYKYDAGGEITGLWNGTVFEQNETEYIIKNAGYNYEIVPNSSVNFGYTLKGENFVVPENFELCSKRVDISEGYDVQLRVDYSWNTGFNGFIVLTNTSDTLLEAWQLSFDTNFNINDLWNGKIIERADEHYKAVSQMSNSVIQPGASVEIGISAAMANPATRTR